MYYFTTAMSLHAPHQPANDPAPKPQPADEGNVARYKRRLGSIADAIASSLAFQWNRVAYGDSPSMAGRNNLLREDALNFYHGENEEGLITGGNPHWAYLSNPFNPAHWAAGSDRYKEIRYHALRAGLAKLPASAALKFHADPLLEEDRSLIRRAFKNAGFKVENRPTFLFKPDTGDFDELVRQFPDNAQKNVLKAARALELTTMDVDSFFDFYRANLQDKGVTRSHFSLDLDQKVLKEEMAKDNSDIKIIAARRKSTPNDPGPHPIDAAILHTRGADGYVKLLRVSYRIAKENDDLPRPHQQAIKLLVTHAMLYAGQNGATLDTDGFTPGGRTLYERFGVFGEKPHDQDVYSRSTIRNITRVIVKKAEPLLPKFA